MKIAPIQALFPKIEAINDPSSFFESIKDEFNASFSKTNFYLVDKPHFYIYKIQDADLVSFGLIGSISKDDVLKGSIHKHEKIFTDKVKILKQYIRRSQAITKPIMVMYEDNNNFSIFLKEASTGMDPILSIPIGNEIHSVYKVENEKVSNLISDTFVNLEECFIADGHHRYGALLEMLNEKSGFVSNVMVALFATDQLRLKPYNRIVNIPSGKRIEEIMVGISQFAEVTKLKSEIDPKRKGEIVVGVGDSWYKVKIKKSVRNNYANESLSIDLLIISQEVFINLLGLDPQDPAIIFVSPDQKREKLECLEQGNCMYFSFYPISIETIMDLSRRGSILPPKSTWFTPKVRSGVIIGKFG